MRSMPDAVIFSMILSLPAAQNRTTQPADPRPAREDVYVFRSVSPQIIFGPEARDAGPAHGRQAGRAERSPQRDSTQRFASGLTTGDVNRLSDRRPAANNVKPRMNRPP